MTIVRPGVLVQPGAAYVESVGGKLFESTEDEIASVQAGQVMATPELWVAGTSMTLLTIDAKLMPVLPVIARPASKRALVVAFGMGSAFRGALITGLRTDAIELVPSVPKMFGWYYADADAVLADPNGRVIVTDGRNHLELAEEKFDIIVTDPPPPIESSGASVISSKEYFEAGRDHLTDGGIMMQWVPYGGLISDFNDSIRTFASVFPEVTLVKGAGGYGVYMIGSSKPVTLAGIGHPGGPRPARRPRGHLVRLRLAGEDRRRVGPGHRQPDVGDRRRRCQGVCRAGSGRHGRPSPPGVLPVAAGVRHRPPVTRWARFSGPRRDTQAAARDDRAATETLPGRLPRNQIATEV